MVQKLEHWLKSNLHTHFKVQLKKLDFFVLCLLLTQNVHLLAQSPKTIKLKIAKPDNEKIILHGYMKNADTIRIGSYKRFKNKVLIESGFFKNNQKDSLWEYFSLSGQLMAVGHYLSGAKTGVWDYFSLSGILVQRFNHTTRQMVFIESEKNTSATADVNNLTLPIFIGGMDFLNSLIQNNVHYPKDAYASGVSGKCFVQFVVDTTGNTTKAMVDANSDVRFAQAAVDVVFSLGRSWIPGSVDGRLVPVFFVLPVSFRPE